MSLQDFVNRDEQLKMFREIVAQKNGIRLLCISGESGIGKTYLLRECQAHCRASTILHFTVDFTDASTQDYLGIIHSVRRQLGYDNFAALNQRLIEIRTLGLRAMTNHGGLNNNGIGIDALNQPQPGRSGGINFADSTVTLRDAAGRDINYITQIFQQDDPFVQAEIRERITIIWQECLRQLAAKHTMICFIDAWEKSSQDIQGWLQSTLINPIIEEQVANLVVILAGQSIPTLRRMPGRIAQFELNGLPQDAVQRYWLEIRGLAVQEWENVYRLTRGHPHIVAAIADLQTLSSI